MHCSKSTSSPSSRQLASARGAVPALSWRHCSRQACSQSQPQHQLRNLAPLRAWQQVTDQASGKPYYWNTATNETAWELPAGAAPAGSQAAAAAAAGATTNQQQPEQQQQPGISFEALLLELQEALDADGSGMMFWEAARARRKDGVFDSPFTDFLEQRQQQGSGSTPEQRDQAFKMMARLSNPLLRQPAPFEF